MNASGAFPGEQVRAVIALVFSLFDRIGTVGGVLGYLAHNGIQVGIRVREWCGRGLTAGSWRGGARRGRWPITRGSPVTCGYRSLKQYSENEFPWCCGPLTGTPEQGIDETLTLYAGSPAGK